MIRNRFSTPFPQHTALDVDGYQSGDTPKVMGNDDNEDDMNGGCGTTSRSLANTMRGLVLMESMKFVSVDPLRTLQRRDAKPSEDQGVR